MYLMLVNVTGCSCRSYCMQSLDRRSPPPQCWTVAYLQLASVLNGTADGHSLHNNAWLLRRDMTQDSMTPAPGSSLELSEA